MPPLSKKIISSQQAPLPLRRPQPHRRNGGGGNMLKHARRKPALLFWLALGMACLLLLYVTVIFSVTSVHWPDGGGSSSNTDKDAAMMGPGLETRANKVRDKLEKAKEQRQEEKKKRNNNGNRVFKRHDLSNPLDHEVEPHALIPERRERDEAQRENREHPAPDHVLKAFLEPANFEEWDVQPLPVRQGAVKENLKEVSYERVNSCSRLQQQWPVDDGPVDGDAFLPWIHDVFPSADGRYVQFVAQNKRRCRNGSKEKHILAQMQPQAALFQHVSVKRLRISGETRYRLASHEDADPDAVATRFLCRFKPGGEETLSEFNVDYDWTAWRKRYRASFVEDDAGIKAIHTTQLLFKCPVPEHLQDVIRRGTSVVSDYATQFVDLIPIRTPPRWGSPHRYLAPRYSEFQEQGEEKFDPVAAWGDDHVLPRIEDSGRWENIPICKPSLMTYEGQQESDLPATVEEAAANKQKKHRLASCIWASAGYTTRGNRFAINDGQRRLLEWITYNKIIGFDHFYIYDNSAAFGTDITLKPVADLFPDEVTYIPWPATICNNNPNNVDSVGERSSQYAAESSCLLRFGPHVHWVGQFDIDEYLVPMGSYKTITSLLNKLQKEDTRIISFASWRAWPRWAFIDEPVPINDPDVCWHNEPCFDLKIPMKYSMLQAYNCDRQKPGQKSDKMPAEKQLYRPDYVLQHFVHYSVVTELSMKNRTEYEAEGFQWKRRGFPDARQRFGDEVNEALMIHTKAVARQDTSGWERMCHINNTLLPQRRQGLCRLGVPYPPGYDEAKATDLASKADKNGRAYNCYVNEKVENELVPLLNQELAKHANFFKGGGTTEQS